MSEYLDSTGLGIYDALIKSYIKSVSGNSTGVRIITLSSAPTSSTLTYTLDGVTYNFKPGDEVRVQNGSDASRNNYLFYKLFDISSNLAYWSLIHLIEPTSTAGTGWNNFNLR